MAKKEITFEEICRDITARKFQPVYVLMGEEPFFIDQITDLLLKSVLEESERDFNQIILYGADTDAISIINAARRFPMMSEYQLIVVREAQLVRDIELLSSYVLCVSLESSGDRADLLFRPVSDDSLRISGLAGTVGGISDRGPGIRPDGPQYPLL